MKRTECPQNCPECNEGEIGGGDEEFDGNLIYRHFQCEKCDFKWVEQYIFEFWSKT